MSTHNDYQVGWICALPLEFAAAEAMLDTLHETLPNRRDDENTCVLGSIRQHNIVIACLPVGVYGTTSATSVGMQMRTSFPSLRFCLLVGVAGGAPGPHADIRLGDVVVSKPTGGYGGVLQYDYGKAVDDGEFVLTGMLDKPPAVLLTALARLQARHHLRGNDIHRFYKEALNKYGQLEEIFSFPGRADDALFLSDYSHVENRPSDCDNCDKDRIHTRPPRSSTHPRVFYGLVASANQVLRSAARRDALSRRHGILCFEMEAAGLIGVLPCLVVRGICDYCDSHKNKQWQGYASMTAAAYAKELLSVIPSNEVIQTGTIKDITLPIRPSGSARTPNMKSAKRPSAEPTSSGFDELSSGNGHPAGEVSLFKPRSAEFLAGRGNRLVIGIELGYRLSTAAWTTTKDFKTYKLTSITSWPGWSGETHHVPTDLGYKDDEVFWGYSIPENIPRAAILKVFHTYGEGSIAKAHGGRSARQLIHDYVLAIYCHIRRTIRKNTMARLANWKFQVVIVVPSTLQSRAKEVESIVQQAFLSDKSLPEVRTVLRSKAAALGQLCMLAQPSLGEYVICASHKNSTDLNTYNLVSMNPMVLQEISAGMEENGVWTGVSKDIEDICRQKLELTSVLVNPGDLREAVAAFRENILRPCFEIENPPRKFFVDIRGVLPSGGVPDNYTYEPHMLGGHICLTEEEIARTFKDGLHRIIKFIDAEISLREDHKIKGIILDGSWGSNPYLFQCMTLAYTKPSAIPVFQERTGHLPVLRGAIYMRFAGKRSELAIVN